MAEKSLLHPTERELRQFIIGKLDDERSVGIEEHLATCEACNNTLAHESHHDALIDLLRSTDDAAAKQPDMRGLDTALRMDASQGGDVTPSDLPEGVPPGLPFHGNAHRYCIERHLGKGGMGSVYLAQDRQLDRLVALKIPNPEHLQDPVWIERFYREARAMATLRHPHLCPVYDVGCADGTHYITMAYIDGESLNETLKHRSYSNRSAAELLQKLARAIEAAHEKGVVHRDLKPSNIMVDQAGEPVVMDFGLAMRESEGDSKLHNHRAVLGTPCYMSPEQVRAEHDKIGVGTDVYSLGVILYELLCGAPPFDGTVESILKSVTSKVAVRPSERGERVDLELENISMRAMSKQVEDRYATAAQMASALTGYLEIDPPARKNKFPRIGVGLAILAILLLAGLGSVFLIGGSYPMTGEARVTDPPISHSPTPRSKTENSPATAGTPLSFKQAKALQHAWAEYLKLDIEYTSGAVPGITFRLVPPGEFLMGSPPDEFGRRNDETAHPVRLTRAYYMSKFEVTQEQFERVMGYNPSRFQRAPGDAPVEQLSWYEAVAFCRNLTEIDTKSGKLPRGFHYTLPTEAEWEFACRAGSPAATYAGKLDVVGDRNAPALDPIAWYSGNSDVEYEDAYDSSGWSDAQYPRDKAGPNPVGKKMPNAWGLYDMLGNVHEWCSDWYEEYPAADTAVTVDPHGPTIGRKKVYRGGGWHSDVDHCRCARRRGFDIDHHYYNAGFRVAAVSGRETAWPTRLEVACQVHTSAENLFRRGHVEQAVAAIQVAADMDPGRPLYLSDQTLLLAAADQHNARYLDSCRTILSLFGDGNGTADYYRLAHALCVLPTDDEIPTKAGHILTGGGVLSESESAKKFYDFTLSLALVEYRRGRYSQAMQAINRICQSDELPPDVGFMKALTLHRLDRDAEAVDVFLQAQKWLLNDETNDPHCEDRWDIWRRVLTARLLHHEAKSIIVNGDSKP